jgi:hypothetical protein
MADLILAIFGLIVLLACGIAAVLFVGVIACGRDSKF